MLPTRNNPGKLEIVQRESDIGINASVPLNSVIIISYQ